MNISKILLMDFRKFLLILLFPLLFTSCETDFDLNAEWKDITVVYGILNQNDDTHYIRIQKAFLGEGNVMQMALEADSSFYPSNLSVLIEEWNNNNLKRTLTLDTVTIDDKEPGIFFSPEQVLYYTQADIDPANDYRLIITNNTTGKIIKSECGLVNDFSITRPVANTQINFNVIGTDFKTFAWRPAKNAGQYQMIMRFNYLDVYFETNDTIPRHLDWTSPIVRSGTTAGSGDLEIRFTNETFFNLIEAHIPKLDEVIRFPENIELIFEVAATELSTYIDVNKPSSSLVQERPEYTNIENGLGVFSARFKKTNVHRIHAQTINKLMEMDGYNFQFVAP